MIINEIAFKKLTANKKLLYPEIYTVRFWVKIENGLEQDVVIYRGDKKGLQTEIKNEFEKAFPKCKLINIIYH